MEASHLFRSLRRFWPVALAIFLICLLLGAVAAFLPAERYRAGSTLLVQPAHGTDDFGAIEAVRTFYLPSLTEEVSTDGFRRSVRKALPGFAQPKGLKLGADIKAGTGIVRITAEALDRQTAALAANIAVSKLVRQKVSKRFTLTQLDAAVPPSSPSSPLKVPIMLSAVALGLILGMFAVLAAAALRREVGTGEEIRKRFGIDVLGEIPAQRDLPSTAAEVFNGKGELSLVESFQRLRTNVDIVVQGRRGATITSCAPGEGKSTVTANLAWALASLDHEVIAIDCDLRKPALHKLFGLPMGPGISDLAEGADLESLPQPTDLPSLSVISAGNAPAHPTQVLHTFLPSILEAHQDRLLLLDTPPMLGVSEATLIATMMKAVLLVVDPRQREPTDLDAVLHEFNRADVHVLGAVLNRARLSRVERASAYYYPRATARTPRAPRS